MIKSVKIFIIFFLGLFVVFVFFWKNQIKIFSWGSVDVGVGEVAKQKGSDGVDVAYFHIFGNARVAPNVRLDGVGTNIDSVDFWETDDVNDTLMFVTGKGNGFVEVWKFPFRGNELNPIRINGVANGVAVDQDRDELVVSESRDEEIMIFSLPELKLVRRFGKGVISKLGEVNVDVLRRDGKSLVLATQDGAVNVFDSETGRRINLIGVPASGMEGVLADSFHQIVYVPEEDGVLAANQGVYAYSPDGKPFRRKNTNLFGNVGGIFNADEEGVALYSCPSDGSFDNGAGFIIIVDQSSPLSQFEFFNRQTWRHLGALTIDGVKNTDGIASTQKALPGYPLGVFAAVDDDTSTVLVGWDRIFKATGLVCD